MNVTKFITDDGVTILRVVGKIISNSMEKLKSGLDSEIEDEEDGSARLIINCKDINVIDSAAVGLLISRSRSLKKRGGKLLFCAPQPATQKLFTMIDTDNWLEVCTTEEEALTAMKAFNNND